jgi:hypothetical protein
MKQTCSVICALIGVATANARETMRVDGVPVYGKVHAVETVDLRNALKIGENRGGVAKLEVLGPADIKVYLRPPDRGYVVAGRFAGIQRDGTRSHDWSWAGPYMSDPEVSELIRKADDLYIFPLLTPRKPHRDSKRMRLLGGDARREIIRLLSSEQNWCQCTYNIVTIGPEPRNIGLLFRRGADELVLFFESGQFVEGTFKGHYIADVLQSRGKMEQWARRYAQAELTAQIGSN